MRFPSPELASISGHLGKETRKASALRLLHFIDDLSPLFINPVMPVRTQCCVTHFEGLISPMWLKGFIAGVTRLERKQGCEMHVVLK